MKEAIITNGPTKRELRIALFGKKVQGQPSLSFVLFDPERQCTIEREFRILSCTRTKEPYVFELIGHLDHDLGPSQSVDPGWQSKVAVKATYNISDCSGTLCPLT